MTRLKATMPDWPETFHEEPPTCAVCRDTGYVPTVRFHRGRTIRAVIPHNPCAYRDSLAVVDMEPDDPFPEITEPPEEEIPWQD